MLGELNLKRSSINAAAIRDLLSCFASYFSTFSVIFEIEVDFSLVMDDYLISY